MSESVKLTADYVAWDYHPNMDPVTLSAGTEVRNLREDRELSGEPRWFFDALVAGPAYWHLEGRPVTRQWRTVYGFGRPEVEVRADARNLP
jgi:hypothetical protein